jgi:hypothetical protein
VRRGAALLLAGLLACEPQAQGPEPHAPTLPPPADPPPAPTTLPTPTSPAITAEQVERAKKAVAVMLQRVVEARQLSATSAVTSQVLPREELLARVKKHTDEDVPKAIAKAQEEVLVALGLMPIGYDEDKGLQQLLGAQLAGFYEPADKSMYLARDLGGDDMDATLAHELVHALQDQHYDLGPKLAFHENAGDAPTALHALAEGDATSAMIDVMVADRGGTALDLPESLMFKLMKAQTQLSPGTASVPGLLKASLIAPYTDGLRFVHALRRRGGWAAVDEAWKHPPTTTEQLLHIEKYLAHEPARAVPPPPLDAPGGAFTRTFLDTMGEQTLRLVLEQWVGDQEAHDAAAGWGGDQIALLTRSGTQGDEHMVTWRLRFDGKPASCPEAREAFAQVCRGILPQGSNPTGGLACHDREDLGPVAAALHGCDVLIVAGPYRQPIDAPHSAGTCQTLTPWLRKVVAQP